MENPGEAGKKEGQAQLLDASVGQTMKRWTQMADQQVVGRVLDTKFSLEEKWMQAEEACPCPACCSESDNERASDYECAIGAKRCFDCDCTTMVREGDDEPPLKGPINVIVQTNKCAHCGKVIWTLTRRQLVIYQRNFLLN